jgi:protease I
VAATQRTPRQKRIDLNLVGEAGAVIALVADGFSVPDQNAAAHAAERGGYKTLIASPNKSLVSGRSATNEEMNFVVDLKPGEISVDKNEGLILPGGAQSIRRLLDDQDSRLLIHDFVKSGKPVFATGEALAIIADASGKEGVEGLAALAIRGEVFAGDGETAVEDAASAFIDALKVVEAA